MINPYGSVSRNHKLALKCSLQLKEIYLAIT